MDDAECAVYGDTLNNLVPVNDAGCAVYGDTLNNQGVSKYPFSKSVLLFNFKLVYVFTILSWQGVDDSNNQYGWMTYNQEQCLLQKVIISLPDDKILFFSM